MSHRSPRVPGLIPPPKPPELLGFYYMPDSGKFAKRANTFHSDKANQSEVSRGAYASSHREIMTKHHIGRKWSMNCALCMNHALEKRPTCTQLTTVPLPHSPYTQSPSRP